MLCGIDLMNLYVDQLLFLLMINEKGKNSIEDRMKA